MGSLLALREPRPPPRPYHIVSTESPKSPAVRKTYVSSTPYNVRHDNIIYSEDTFSNQISRHIRIAALNDPYSGKVHTPMRIGHSAADYQCNQESSKYGGNFRAFLTNRILDASSIVHRRERHLPVRNLNGELLFNSWNSIFNGSRARFFENPVNIYSFNMRNVLIDPHWPRKVVWHGSDARGIRLTDSYCNQWQSDSPSDYGAASSLYSTNLLGQELFNCDNKLIVLCVEVSSSEPRRKRHSLKRIHDNRDAHEHNFIEG